MCKSCILVCFSSSKERGGGREGRQRLAVKLNRPPARAPFAGPPSLPSSWRMRSIQECNTCTFASASMIFSLAPWPFSSYALRKAAALERKSMLASANVQEYYIIMKYNLYIQICHQEQRVRVKRLGIRVRAKEKAGRRENEALEIQ